MIKKKKKKKGSCKCNTIAFFFKLGNLKPIFFFSWQTIRHFYLKIFWNEKQAYRYSILQFDKNVW